MARGIKMRNTIVNGGMTGVAKGINKVFAYSEGKSYSMVKERVQASNPNTVAQQAVRALFAQTSSNWSNLTDVERAGWNNEAPNWVNTDVFGTKKQSGKNLFTGCNIVLQTANLPLIDSPGTREFFCGKITTQVYTASGSLGWFMANDFATPDESIVMEMTSYKSQGTSVAFDFRTIKSATLDYGAAQTLNILPQYESVFGTMSAGRKIFWRVYKVSKGGNKVLVDSGVALTE